jgi:hypothetical protein
MMGLDVQNFHSCLGIYWNGDITIIIIFYITIESADTEEFSIIIIMNIFIKVYLFSIKHFAFTLMSNF